MVGMAGTAACGHQHCSWERTKPDPLCSSVCTFQLLIAVSLYSFLFLLWRHWSSAASHILSLLFPLVFLCSPLRVIYMLNNVTHCGVVVLIYTTVAEATIFPTGVS